MAFDGSVFSNETWNRRQIPHARHIACPQHLKYIHDVNDGYIPYVKDSGYINQSSYRNVSPKTNRLNPYNTADTWRQELMGLAQQVQSSLLLLNDLQPEPRLTPRRFKRINSSLSTSHLEENSEENISKRLLNRRASAHYQHSSIPKSRLSMNENEQELSTDNKNQDPGIWLLPMLCDTLQVDNISDAQEWLVNANSNEKRLAKKLISRTMQDMQHHENEYISTRDQSNFNNLYWPYKFWQHQQQQPKLIIDNNDTCERATSPVRILTPAKRLSTPSIVNRTDQSPQRNLTETRCSSSRLLTPMTANNSDRQSRRSYRVTTSRSTSTDNDSKPLSANLRVKTPLI